MKKQLLWNPLGSLQILIMTNKSIISLSFSPAHKRKILYPHWVTWHPPTITLNRWAQLQGNLSTAWILSQWAMLLCLVCILSCRGGGGLLSRGISWSHLIFISYCEIRDHKSIWSPNNTRRWLVLGTPAGVWVCSLKTAHAWQSTCLEDEGSHHR